MLILYIIIIAIAFVIGLYSPKGVAFVITIANIFLPDPIPFGDELGLIVGFLFNIKRSSNKKITSNKQKTIESK